MRLLPSPTADSAIDGAFVHGLHVCHLWPRYVASAAHQIGHHKISLLEHFPEVDASLLEGAVVDTEVFSVLVSVYRQTSVEEDNPLVVGFYLPKMEL